MHHRRKHPTGKPHLRKNSSDWSYPLLEKGSSKQGRASVKRMLMKFPLTSEFFVVRYRK